VQKLALEIIEVNLLKLTWTDPFMLDAISLPKDVVYKRCVPKDMKTSGGPMCE
jgi:hypothetical protein